MQAIRQHVLHADRTTRSIKQYLDHGDNMQLKKLALAVAVVGATLGSSLAYAAYVQYWTLTEYYSDASFSTVTGHRLRNCNGQVSTVGTATVYKQVIEQYNCAYPLP